MVTAASLTTGRQQVPEIRAGRNMLAESRTLRMTRTELLELRQRHPIGQVLNRHVQQIESLRLRPSRYWWPLQCPD